MNEYKWERRERKNKQRQKGKLMRGPRSVFEIQKAQASRFKKLNRDIKAWQEEVE